MLRRFSRERNMLYELRIYECVPGRLPDLLKRFSTITLKLWEKHRIRQAGFWTTLIGESNQTLLYAGLGIARRTRDQVERLRRGPRLARRSRKNRGKRPDRRQGHELHPRPD